MHPAGGVGTAGDALEVEADQVATKVERGETVALPGPVGGGAGRSLQRFESDEHRLLGDRGSMTADGRAETLELAPGYFISFGEMTAMAGDFFGSLSVMRSLARVIGTGAGTREEKI